jgi:hypothetical protein
MLAMSQMGQKLPTGLETRLPVFPRKRTEVGHGVRSEKCHNGPVGQRPHSQTLPSPCCLREQHESLAGRSRLGGPSDFDLLTNFDYHQIFAEFQRT